MRIDSSKKIFILFMLGVLPFICSTVFFLHSTVDIRKNEIISSLKNFTIETVNDCVTAPKDATNLAFNALEKSSLVSDEAISDYISDKQTGKQNAIISTLVNSNVYISGAIATDNEDHYRIYPPSTSPKFTPSEQAWYASGAKSGVVNYSDYTMTIKKNGKESKVPVMLGSADLYDDDVNKVGNITLGVTLTSLNEKIKLKQVPYSGSFFVANSTGKVLMGTKKNGNITVDVPESWMNKSQSADEGWFYDAENQKYIYFKASSNPDWTAFSAISERDYSAFINQGKTTAILLTILGVVFSLFIYIAMSSYIKNLLSTIYMQANGIEVKKDKTTFESIAMSMSDKNKKLKEAKSTSFTDELTGLYNRRKLSLDISDLISEEKEFCFALIDLDNFKSINDVFGHVKGDAVLKYVSSTGMEIMGDKSNIYRYGGEEIAVIFDSSDKVECLNLLEAWRKRIVMKKWRERGLTASFSGGLTVYNNTESEDQLYSRTDKLLYEAKRKGKNQIVHHHKLSQVISL